jgi:MoaA/NifB/PqqE/SkfB family radical SAM enzyme
MEQALRSDKLRGLALKELERRLVAQISGANTQRPEQVVRDQCDMALAVMRAIDRALAREQISSSHIQHFLRNMMTNWILHQDRTQQDAQRGFQQRQKGALPPTTMVISPTKACNLHCTGCYASGPGGARLEWDVFHRIIEEAKSEWGMRFFTISGGEPLAYRSAGRDLLEVIGAHNDCFFLMYTNGTLIDEEMAQRMAEGGNLTPAISIEGFEQRTDARRGDGVFKRILAAMDNLREARVPFGISLTATRHNAEEILSDEFIDFFFEEQSVVYGWLFQYMPIGRSYTLDLLVTPEQRLWMWRRTWEIIRDRGYMLVDFWNCGTASTGCIAAGRAGGYLYTDWNGKVMPCVFVPYAAGNIHDIYASGSTLDAVFDLPYLAAIREWQSEYGYDCKQPDEHGNWLLPCSLRDNYSVGRSLIDRYEAEPEDEAAAEALIDGDYCEGMMAYDEALRQLFDPVWQGNYLNKGRD